LSNPFSITFPALTAFTLTWTLTDANNNPINNAVVTANLYAGRSLQNPSITPGVLVSPIIAVNLPYVASSAGQYAAAIPATLNPALEGVYVLVIDAAVAGTEVYHQEVPAVIETAGSPLDLTTVELVKDWLTGFGSATSTVDDAKIQGCITAWGYEFLGRTGLGDQNGDFLQSPFVQICNFNETYDGMGTFRLFLRNRPITNVIALVINGVSIGQSTATGVSGWVVDGSGKSIALRQGLTGWGSPSPSSWNYQSGPFSALGVGLRFWQGIQNVNVQYSAGYNQTPFDIVECANKVVAQNYRRRTIVDEESRALAGGAGTIRWRSWDVPPECQGTINRYTRTL
jgi:hypothetical protein